MHGLFINGTTGEWFSQTPDERRLVAETAIEQVAGRVPVVDRLHVATRRSEAVELGRHAIAAGADGIGSTPPPYAKTYPDETVRVLPGHLRRHRRADRWSTTGRTARASTSSPTSPSGSRTIDNVVAIKDSTPNLAAVLRDDEARASDSVRVFGPFMSVAGLELLLEHGGDGFIGGGSLWGAPDAEFWEAVWRGDVEVCRAHARRTDELFPKLWLPGGWGGQFGGLPEPAQGADEDARPAGRRGAPAAAARRPTPASLQRDARDPGRGGLLREPVEAA